MFLASLAGLLKGPIGSIVLVTSVAATTAVAMGGTAHAAVTFLR